MSDCACISLKCLSSPATKQQSFLAKKLKAYFPRLVDANCPGRRAKVTVVNRMANEFKLANKCISMHNFKMNNLHNEIDITAVARVAKMQKVTQYAIAKAIGVSQSQVSRVLAGSSNKRSKLTDKICNYVNNSTKLVSIESVRHNEELMSALAATWDGTPRNSLALATVIRSLRVLAPDVPTSASK